MPPLLRFHQFSLSFFNVLIFE
ncbi:hypothetical protein CFP56_026506 [Quercus suber]|uniref:Uncharacterized protein n=1 Tax=Quercus suber TaxID=58331 RepID=A0AAW0JZR6_QUESU